MKFFGCRIFDRSFQLAFTVVKLSGYIFYTIKDGENNKINFKRTFIDYGLFALSFLFSVFAYLHIGNRSFNANLKSAVMSIAMNLLFKLLLISVMLTKIYHFVRAKNAFDIVASFKWIEVKVGSKFSSLELKAETTFADEEFKNEETRVAAKRKAAPKRDSLLHRLRSNLRDVQHGEFHFGGGGRRQNHRHGRDGQCFPVHQYINVSKLFHRLRGDYLRNLSFP